MKVNAAVLILLFAGICCASAKETFGWLERVRIGPKDLVLSAKLDTGADHSSLDAAHIVRFHLGPSPGLHPRGGVVHDCDHSGEPPARHLNRALRRPLPMVILTMAIEHMSIQWEERGAAEAMKQGFGTLVVASIAYLAMNVDALRHLLLVFPELLLVLLSSILLLGRYSGYRLLELRRFRAFTVGDV